MIPSSKTAFDLSSSTQAKLDSETVVGVCPPTQVLTDLHSLIIAVLSLFLVLFLLINN